MEKKVVLSTSILKKGFEVLCYSKVKTRNELVIYVADKIIQRGRGVFLFFRTDSNSREKENNIYVHSELKSEKSATALVIALFASKAKVNIFRKNFEPPI